jgi:hypothetical protein
MQLGVKTLRDDTLAVQQARQAINQGYTIAGTGEAFAGTGTAYMKNNDD